MSSILWLASYPKSGNTWLRVLLANYLRDAGAPASINELGDGRFAHAGRRALFDDLVGLEASGLAPAAIDRLRPGAYRLLAAEAPQDVFIKVHDAWTRADDGSALFPAQATAGVIYIVRNPLDVAVSLSHHMGVDVETAVGRMCDASYVMSDSTARLDDQLRQFLGSWSGHVRSWLDDSGLPCHVVRYEDLHRNAEGSLTRILRFCGLPDEAVRVGKAVAFSDFAELRRQERQNGFCERLPVARGAFFRRGTVGGWREELTIALASRLIEAHREMMQRFGYADDPYCRADR